MYEIMNDLETELENGTISLKDFVTELADNVFDGISDEDLHEYLIDEGYFANTTELLECYHNN